MRCIPPVIQQMPAHHAHNHPCLPINNTDPALGAVFLHSPPGSPAARPPHRAAPCTTPPPRHGSPGRRRHICPPPWQRGTPAQSRHGWLLPRLRRSRRQNQHGAAVGAPRPAEARNNWVRYWDAVPDPLGGECFPVVREVYGWLNWATSGYKRNRSYDAVPLRRNGGNPEEPPVGWVARDNHQSILLALIWAGWPDRKLERPPFLEGGALLRVTDSEGNVWLPRALRAALIHWRHRRRIPPLPQPQSPQKR